MILVALRRVSVK